MDKLPSTAAALSHLLCGLVRELLVGYQSSTFMSAQFLVKKN